jgi:hypothetical protein
VERAGHRKSPNQSLNQTGKKLRFYVKSVQVSPLMLAAAHAHRSAEKIGYYVYFDFRLRL